MQIVFTSALFIKKQYCVMVVMPVKSCFFFMSPFLWYGAHYRYINVI